MPEQLDHPVVTVLEYFINDCSGTFGSGLFCPTPPIFKHTIIISCFYLLQLKQVNTILINLNNPGNKGCMLDTLAVGFNRPSSLLIASTQLVSIVKVKSAFAPSILIIFNFVVKTNTHHLQVSINVYSNITIYL